MSIKDKLERILREMHIMVSRGQISEIDEAYVLIPKKEMQQLLNGIKKPRAVRSGKTTYGNYP